MAEISKITLPSGSTYDLKDATARAALAGLTGAMHFIGVTTTALTDGASTNPVTIGGANVTASSGDVAIYSTREYVFSGTDSKWHEFGSTGSLKALAFKDTASGKITPAGTVSKPTFSGTAATITSSYTPSGTVSVVPNTTSVYSITATGSLPSWGASVSDETLTLSWSAGTLPTKGSAQTVATGIKSATFSGTEGSATASYTPSGTVSQPKFTGTEGSVTVS